MLTAAARHRYLVPGLGATAFPQMAFEAQYEPKEYLMTHKFNIGQIVELERASFRSAALGPYEIRHLIPASDQDPDDPCYRIKSVAEKHGRVAPESELQASKGSFRLR